MKKEPIFNLDSEEQELSDALDKLLDKGKLESVPNLEEELAFAKKAAANYLKTKRNKQITISISNQDLTRLKEKAAHEGLPYPAFIEHVLHEYAAGHLK